MPRFLLRDSILVRRFLVLVCFLALTCAFAPLALAQRPVVHPVGGGHVPSPGHFAPPHVVAPPAFRPPVVSVPPVSEFGTQGVGFGPRPIFFPRHHFFFFREPFSDFGASLWLESYWWMNCGSPWTWEFACNGAPTNLLTYENSARPPVETRVYVYAGDQHEQVQLFLKDGRIYSANDYWFVNGQVHFSMVAELEDGARRLLEHVIAFDELDVQKTVDVNTRRGFRLVMRDEPWPQYLRDHPDANPPALVAPQAN